MKTCDHYWNQPHSVYEGRKEGESAIIRYCEKCETVQMAFIESSSWGKVPDEYDVSFDVPFLEEKECV